MSCHSGDLSCMTCPMRVRTEWAALQADDLTILDRKRTEQSYRAGDVLFHQGDEGDGVFCVRSAVIGLRRLDADGNSVLIRMVQPGETVGYRSFLTNSEHTVSAEVLGPGDACFIPRATLRSFLQKNPELGFRFLTHSLRDLEDVEKRYVQSRTWSVRARVLHTLLVLYEGQGKRADGRDCLTLPMTRTELATVVGTTPETLSRTSRTIERDGLIRVEGQQICFPDLDALWSELPVT